ncbi:MAG: hypothetical protein KF726_11390 [Anaerolineae bacterium]|nr:hypothetical protein [Anaerolineae bacterium]
MNDENVVYKALARAVAQREIPDHLIQATAKRLATAGEQIRRLDICAYGICVDYFISADKWWQTLPKLLEVGGVGRIEIFPWGIPFPDLFHVHVEHSI